jgi:lipopolysaccharide assembly outer membrane protein LptD (OstA)
MKSKRLYLLFFTLGLLCVPALGAQEAAPPPDAETTADGEAAAGEAAAEEEAAVTVPDPDAAIHELDIKTSSLAELASWCRSLGLSDGGNKEELARRLRDHYKIPEPGSGEAPGRKTVIIESARSTEYFTLEALDEEYARLTGDVIISLKDGNSVHRIRAWEILYNRTRNIMTASGAVEYVREEGDSIETFKGETITVNLDNWSSIFLEGISERSMRDDATAYRFAGTVISRSDESVTVLSRAEISNANNPDAIWSLTASKLWLLPGSDFAVFNAILKVGEIPVLYIPFFHFPADEVIFHPVLGIRSREGSFLQTTTYLLGRPKAVPPRKVPLPKYWEAVRIRKKDATGSSSAVPEKKYRIPTRRHFRSCSICTRIWVPMPEPN